MLFNSYIFVLLFLPLSVAGYFLLNRRNTRLATAYLLGMSLWFYAYFNVAYLPLIVGSILLNFSLNKLMRRFPAQRVRKGIMLLGVFINIGVLFYYKYYDFFATNVNSLFGAHWTLLNLVLPLGISFFTFQQVSYMIDSYKGEVPDYPLLDYALFVTFFPQLIAGPIVLHSEIVPQFMDPAKRRFQWENFSRGLYAFALGMAKKVLLADVFGIAVNYAFANIPSLNSTNALIGAVGYIFQMYFDFSGYGDMAVGLGLMFNIEIPNNFLAPLRARNVREFWKRWHITLTRFFTRYVYFPLGGSRVGKWKTMRNMLAVWAFTGLWHGASWNFVLWGLIFFVLLTLEKNVYGKFLERTHLLKHAYIIFIIPLTWMVFAIPDMHQLGTYFTRLFPFLTSDEVQSNTRDAVQAFHNYWKILVPCVLFSTPLPLMYYKKFRKSGFCLLLLLILFVLSIRAMMTQTNNPFLYFQF